MRGSYGHVAGKTTLGVIITATYVGQAFAVAAGLKGVFYKKAWRAWG